MRMTIAYTCSPLKKLAAKQKRWIDVIDSCVVYWLPMLYLDGLDSKILRLFRRTNSFKAFNFRELRPVDP